MRLVNPLSRANVRVIVARALIAVVVAGAALGSVARADETASVVIDGRHIPLHPPAILRDGSVFVPVRGVFEHLGASVVFSSGRITAHGKNGEVIVMDVGQRSASVNGAHVMLDAPPFIQGSTTFVPLRFVSVALGAAISFDNRSKTVYIQSPQPKPVQTPVPPQPVVTPVPTATPVPQSQYFRLLDEQPRPGSDVRTTNPAISANFSDQVDPNSIVVTLDGRDLTSASFIGANRFSVTPSFDLPQGSRTVAVTGITTEGKRFSQNWSFNVRAPLPSVSRNYIQIRTPGEGSSVSSTFQLAGRTLPLSQVTVAASTTYTQGGGGIIGPSFTRQTRSDPFGNFSVDVSVPNAGAYVRVFIQSTSGDGSSVEKALTFAVQPG